MNQHDWRDLKERATAIGVVAAEFAFFLIVILIVVSGFSYCTASWAEQGSQSPEQVATAIRTLQPAATPQRASRLANLFAEAATQHDHDPLLLVALSMRESSLLPRVEERRYVGDRGEIGLMQTHGVALRFRPDGCSTELESAWCQIQTGSRFLAAVRTRCGGSWYRWVGSYGASRCLTEDEARAHASTKIARRYYTQIGGTQWN